MGKSEILELAKLLQKAVKGNDFINGLVKLDFDSAVKRLEKGLYE